METNIILNGDCLEHLKELPSESINCVMTSPPYWALRDYGTARWEGGSSECNHKIDRFGNRKVTENTKIDQSKQGSVSGEYVANGELCPKCGAKRIDQQLGLEPTFQEYINKLCDIFDEVKRVLRKDGTCWVNLGDTYNNSGWAGDKPNKFDHDPKDKKGGLAGRGGQLGFQDKSLCLIPFRFAIEMQNRGWILRNVIIWHKPNVMPSSVKDRFTVDFEYLFFFVKNKKYYFETQYEQIAESSFNDNRKDKGLVPHKSGKSMDIKLIQGRTQEQKLTKQDLVGNRTYTGFNERYKESQYGMNGTSINSYGRNKRTVWTITTKPFKEAHFAVYPEEICETPIKAGCPIGGIVLDPFFGSGTTGLVALKQNKQFIGIELNPEYIKIAQARLKPYLEQRKLI
jgi:site-specific DNA-methyltransferase (cytosine-N4-specific)